MNKCICGHEEDEHEDFEGECGAIDADDGPCMCVEFEEDEDNAD